MLIWRLEFRSDRIFTDMNVAFAEVEAQSVWSFSPSDWFMSRSVGVYCVELADCAMETVERASIIT